MFVMYEQMKLDDDWLYVYLFCQNKMFLLFMLQPETVSHCPVSRHLTFAGVAAPSYPVAHVTLAIASYEVTV